MTTIGFIGAGNIGSHMARQAIAAGYDVVMSNSRGPETLTELVADLGPQARAATANDAAAAADIAVVTIPLKAIDQVPVAPMIGKTVLDTNNYYPGRDGVIDALEDGSATSSGLLQAHLPESHVVKAFNHIPAANIVGDAQAAGNAGRRALAIFGDDADAKRAASDLIERFGFDVVDGGALADSWRIQPDTPGYGPRMDADQLRDALAAATGKSPS